MSLSFRFAAGGSGGRAWVKLSIRAPPESSLLPPNKSAPFPPSIQCEGFAPRPQERCCQEANARAYAQLPPAEFLRRKLPFGVSAALGEMCARGAKAAGLSNLIKKSDRKNGRIKAINFRRENRKAGSAYFASAARAGSPLRAESQARAECGHAGNSLFDYGVGDGIAEANVGIRTECDARNGGD